MFNCNPTQSGLDPPRKLCYSVADPVVSYVPQGGCEMRRFAFVSGLILGGSVTAWLLGAALCYLFTGKLASIQVDQNQRPRLSLVDVGGLYETPPVVGASSGGAARAWDTNREAV
jgi:hypothetical protein